MAFLIISVLLGSYLVGAIPFGYLVARSRGVNIFQQGSGNIGATNVGRVLGRRFGLLVFFLDFAKGGLPVLVSTLAVNQLDIGSFGSLGKDEIRVGAGLAAILGHMFSVFLHFRGGKGVATSAGVLAVLLPLPALGGFLAWLAVTSATRYVSLASVVAAAALCVLRLLGVDGPFAANNLTLTGFCFLATGLVFLRHRANLGRLIRGNENRLPPSSFVHTMAKTIHVLALGLWFGSVLFFTFVVALVIFQTFESLGMSPPSDRPAWLPLADHFDKEQGTRLAGAAIGPLFPWYYALQGACGFLAVVTALGWSRLPTRKLVHHLRTLTLILALLTVVAGWPLAQKVSELRYARYDANPAVADKARADFRTLHLYSLLLNFMTIILVTIGMVCAAHLPPSSEDPMVVNEGKATDTLG